jgi:hypothetical protein
MEVMETWRAEPGRAFSELRDQGLLKLFLDVDPVVLAKTYLPEYEATLQRFEELRNASGGIQVPRGPWLAFDAGIGHLRERIRFWKQLLEEGGEQAGEEQEGEEETIDE